jgi:hypothetical protein
MKGTIRVVVGLLVVMGAVGGLDADTATMAQGLSLSALGLALMAWGTYAMNKEHEDA